MQKQQAGKMEVSPSGCVFSGVPLYKLQKIRVLHLGTRQLNRTRPSVLLRSGTTVGKAA
ncbi:MAG: hypothetical protein NTY53_14215 [Kiritimatiellaeota bacterium]|nr:hypothetical protein [Kiritimatiellota bacterium]